MICTCGYLFRSLQVLILKCLNLYTIKVLHPFNHHENRYVACIVLKNIYNIVNFIRCSVWYCWSKRYCKTNLLHNLKAVDMSKLVPNSTQLSGCAFPIYLSLYFVNYNTFVSAFKISFFVTSVGFCDSI